MNDMDIQPAPDATPEVTYRVRWEHSAECPCGRCLHKHALLARRRGAS